MKKLFITTLVLAATLTFGASAQGAVVYRIDINDANASVTEPGWTGLDAAHTGNGGSVTVGDITFSASSSLNVWLTTSTAPEAESPSVIQRSSSSLCFSS